MSHSSACQAAIDARIIEIAAWAARWPNHCWSCQGTGVSVSPGCSVPYGETSVSLPDSIDPCPDCSVAGLCPRCGQPGLTSEDRGDDTTGDGPCKVCGWDNGKEKDDCCPGEAECFCWAVLGDDEA